jgi:hypothetical protein
MFEVPVNLGSLTDKNIYALYYETEDCTRTAERLYTYGSGGWSTNYKSVVYTVDDDAPMISITVPSTGAIYPANAAIPSNFLCTDLGSGVAPPPNGCYGTNPNVVSAPKIQTGGDFDTTPTTSSVLTGKTFTVTGTDNVGNTSSQSVNYSVSCLYAENTINPSNLMLGENFTITPSVKNCTKSLQSLTVSVVLSGPMGTSCAPKTLTLVNGLTVPVPAGASASVTLPLPGMPPFSIPKNACVGTYTFTTTSSTKGVTDFSYSESLTVSQ